MRDELERERIAAQVALEGKLVAERELKEFRKESMNFHEEMLSNDTLTREYTGFTSGTGFSVFLVLLLQRGAANAYQGLYWQDGELMDRLAPRRRLAFAPTALALTHDETADGLLIPTPGPLVWGEPGVRRRDVSRSAWHLAQCADHAPVSGTPHG